VRHALVALVLVVLAACGGGSADAPSADSLDEPNITGAITSITPFEPVTEDCADRSDATPEDAVSSDDRPTCTSSDNDIAGSFVVESDDGDQGSLTVDGDTDLGEVAFDDLEVGQTVSVWVSGPIAESFPWQARADIIRVEPT